MKPLVNKTLLNTLGKKLSFQWVTTGLREMRKKDAEKKSPGKLFQTYLKKI